MRIIDMNKKNSLLGHAQSTFSPVDWVSLIYLSMAAGVIPLIVRIQQVPANPAELALFPGPAQVLDVFSYNKAMALIGATVLAILGYGILFRGSGGITSNLSGIIGIGIKNKPAPPAPLIFSPMLEVRLALALGLTFVLSAVFSPFSGIVLWGAYQRYEGLFVLLSYIVVFLGARSFGRNSLGRGMFIGILSASATVIGAIAMTQLAGRDFFLTPFGARLVYGDFYTPGAELVATLTIAYSTLYNPNYLGQYAAITVPLFALAAVHWGGWRRVILAGLAALMLASLIASGSSGAMFSLVSGVGFAFLIGIGLMVRRGFGKRTVIGLLCAVITAVGIGLIPPIRQDIVRMANRFVEGVQPHDFVLNDIAVGLGYAAVHTRAGELRAVHTSPDEAPQLYFDGQPVQASDTQLHDAGARDLLYDIPGLGQVVVRDIGNLLQISANQTVFNFHLADNGYFAALTQSGLVIDLDHEIPRLGFYGHEGFASSRGYIWSRTIPVIIDAPLLGYGPDTFTLAFPQHDIRGKLAFFGEPYIRVDKPHNIYMQFATNTGLISAIALLGLLGLALLRGTLRLLDKNPTNTFLKLALVTSVFAFTVSGLVNDSNVSTSPVLWAILGMSYATFQATD